MFFHDIIDSCFSRDRYQWNYYATELSINPLSFPDRSYEFIYQYFKNGAKEYAVSLADQCFIAPTDFCSNSNPKSMNFVKLAPLRISKYRAAHTVSTYFFGIFLAEQLHPIVGEVNIRSGRNTFPFSYLWFLLCLYHDFGYVVEENWKPNIYTKTSTPSFGKRGFFELKALNRALGIKYTPALINRINNRRSTEKHHQPTAQELDRKLLELCPPLNLQYENQANITRFTYSTNIIHRYFSYCIHELRPSVYNHGIVGGYLFFDRMFKNYLTSYTNYCSEPREVRLPLDDFMWRDKHFSIDQIPLFAYLADCIIAHNIWKADSDHEGIYLQYGLSKLVDSQFRKIFFYSNPLLFFLAITDTLDPYKTYGLVSESAEDALSIWRSIDYTFNGGTLTITSYDERYLIKRLFEKAKGLESWTEVTGVQLINDTSFRLTII